MGNTDILSIQLYTLRSLGELDRVLDTVKQAGYRHVETVGSQLDDAENVRTKLDVRGLKVSSSHVSLAALRERPDVVVRACRTLCGLRPALYACRAAGTAAERRAVLARVGVRARRDRRAHARPGDRFRLSQPPLGTRTEGRREDRAGADLRGGGGQPARLAGGLSLVGSGRRRSQKVDAALRGPG